MRAKDQRGPYLKSLENRPGQRHYLTAVDPEDGRHYFWETVEDRGELVAIKQLEIDYHGRRWRYDWQHLEDENGFLTEASLYLDKNITEVTRDEFEAQWRQDG